MTLSFMIKKKYLEEKLSEQEQTGTFHERREYKKFWRSRIRSTRVWHRGGNTVFLCGRYAFDAEVLSITITPTPEAYTIVAGRVCYDIKCRFSQEELEQVAMFVDDAIKEVYELIKQDECTIFQSEH